MAWELVQCGWRDTPQLNHYLAASWEPFAATETDDGTTIWSLKATSGSWRGRRGK